MTSKKALKPAVAVFATGALCATMAIAPFSSAVPQAQANTYSNLVNAQNKKAASSQREAQLRSQLSGVKSDLADKIVELDELTNTKIPAAQAAVDEANATAASAQSEADAAASRLEAAQKDKENLEAQIEQTGKDYDDAHAAVAQMAREDLHGSDASTVMSVVTGSTSTQEFINSMQSRDALSRTEANAASDAANTLNTSMNRSERLSAIEKQIANLKTAADEKAASAQQAAASAQTQRDSLDQLRAEGEPRRAELESQQSQLNGSVAKQAAQTVMLQSQVDSFNRQYAAEQAAAANQNNGGNQGQTRPGNNNTNSGGNNVTPAPAPTPTPTPAPAPSTNNNSGQGTSNGDYGNGYVAGQCTWWAYERRRQMGIGTPSYLGNGGQWYATAPSYGLRVDHSPQVGAAISFLPGQAGQWDEEAQGAAALTAVHGGINRQKASQPLHHRVVFTGGDTGAQSARRAQRGGDILAESKRMEMGSPLCQRRAEHRPVGHAFAGRRGDVAAHRPA